MQSISHYNDSKLITYWGACIVTMAIMDLYLTPLSVTLIISASLSLPPTSSIKLSIKFIHWCAFPLLPDTRSNSQSLSNPSLTKRYPQTLISYVASSHFCLYLSKVSESFFLEKTFFIASIILKNFN